MWKRKVKKCSHYHVGYIDGIADLLHSINKPFEEPNVVVYILEIPAVRARSTFCRYVA